MIGIDRTVWALQIVNFLVLAGWLVLTIVALTRLRRCQLDETARVLWVIVILLIPLLGAVAFFVVSPGKPRPGEEQ
ncbi:MAG: PLDc N-terminal domain-containing protein [Chloroflexota bacterium]|nr:PLDc N-terminal domain-containing protein [Chloroflexota bacterium]